MIIGLALEVLRKQSNCWDKITECSANCEECECHVDASDLVEAVKTVLDNFPTQMSETSGKDIYVGTNDLVSRSYLLAEYDRQHQGPPGGARKIIEEAPPVLRNSEMSESLKFEEIGKSVLAGFESGIRNFVITDRKLDSL